jgi:hypothetical protein
MSSHIRWVDYGGGLFSRRPVRRYLDQRDVENALKNLAHSLEQSLREKGKDPAHSTMPIPVVVEMIEGVAEKLGSHG